MEDETIGLPGSDSGFEPEIDSGVDDSTPTSTEGSMPSAEATGPTPQLVPVNDLNSLKSVKDREINQLNSALSELMNYNYAMQMEMTQLKNAGKDPAVIEAEQAKLQAEFSQRMAAMQARALEPIARNIVTNNIAQKYGVKVEDIADIDDPVIMEKVAMKFAAMHKSATLQDRKAKGVDKQEGSSSSGSSKIKEENDPMKLFDMGYTRR